jgi:hypothetical protein
MQRRELIDLDATILRTSGSGLAWEIQTDDGRRVWVPISLA